MALQKLPSEILILIVDYLDKESLAKLARTASKLARITHRALYKRIELTWDSAHRPPLLLLLRTFFEGPPIANIVQTLSIKSSDHSENCGCEDLRFKCCNETDRCSSLTCTGEAREILRQLRSGIFQASSEIQLQDLELPKEVDDDYVFENTEKLIPFTLFLTKRLRRLNVGGNLFHNWRVLDWFLAKHARPLSQSFVEALNHLEEVTLNFSEPLCSRAIGEPSVARLPFLEFFGLPQIRSISIHALSDEYWKGFHESCESLEQLTLHKAEFEIWHDLDFLLQKCPGLKTLSVELEYDDGDGSPNYSEQTKVDRTYIYTALARFERTLETLCLSLSFWRERELTDYLEYASPGQLSGSFGSLKDFQHLRILGIPLYILFGPCETNEVDTSLSKILPEKLVHLTIIDDIVPEDHNSWTADHMVRLFTEYFKTSPHLKSFCLSFGHPLREWSLEQRQMIRGVRKDLEIQFTKAVGQRKVCNSCCIKYQDALERRRRGEFKNVDTSLNNLELYYSDALLEEQEPSSSGTRYSWRRIMETEDNL